MSGNITKGQIKLLLLVLIVAILFAGYRFGYQPFAEKNDNVKKEIEDYKSKISVLDAKITHEKQYRDGIASADTEAYKVLDLYGGGNTREKTIMMLVALEQASEMRIAAATFGNDANIYYTNNVKSTTGLGVFMFKQPLTISFTVTYDGIKKAMDFINSNKERMTVDNMTLSYDSATGQLSGTMVLNLYSVMGGNAVYTDPATGITEFGTENVFGTFDDINIIGGDDIEGGTKSNDEPNGVPEVK